MKVVDYEGITAPLPADYSIDGEHFYCRYDLWKARGRAAARVCCLGCCVPVCVRGEGTRVLRRGCSNCVCVCLRTLGTSAGPGVVPVPVQGPREQCRGEPHRQRGVQRPGRAVVGWCSTVTPTTRWALPRAALLRCALRQGQRHAAAVKRGGE